MAFGPITSWHIDGETVETVVDFILGGSKITSDGDCSHEIKRHLLLGRSYDQSTQHIKKQNITLPGVLWFMGSQRVGHDWATELNWTELIVRDSAQNIPPGSLTQAREHDPFICSKYTIYIQIPVRTLFHKIPQKSEQKQLQNRYTLITLPTNLHS